MTHRLASLVLAAALALAAAVPARAAIEDIVPSMRLRGIEVSAEQEQAILDELAAARDLAEPVEMWDVGTGLALDMVQLSQEASRASARVRLTEMHRQIMSFLLPDGGTAIDLYEAFDPSVKLYDDGVGVTGKDLGWAIMIQAMHADLPFDPLETDIPSEQSEAYLAQFYEELEEANFSQGMFLSRLDAWGTGMITAWYEMTEEQRMTAVSVIAEDDIPSNDILELVIGTTDLLYWLAGMDIGLTEDEKARYPELAAQLERGYMRNGLDGLLAQRAQAMAAARASGMAVGAANINSVLMMQNLNYGLLFGNDLTAGSLMGFE